MCKETQEEKTTSFLQKTIYVTISIITIIIVVFLCIMIYKNSFSIETLLSFLLAFFSIFISVLFYFKATESSNKFYDNSYHFMKDISVTLGKIEERFGEKLQNINDKIAEAYIKKEKTETKLEEKEQDKEEIEQLLKDKELSEEQKKELEKKLFITQNEINIYKQKLSSLERELTARRIYSENSLQLELRNFKQELKIFSDFELNIMQHEDYNNFPDELKIKLAQCDNFSLTIFNNPYFKDFIQKERIMRLKNKLFNRENHSSNLQSPEQEDNQL